MQTVIGLFENAADAQRAAQQLKSNGFTSENVDVSLKDDSSSTENYSSGNNYTSADDTSADTLSGTLPGDILSGNTMTGTSNSMTGSIYGDSDVSGSSNYSSRSSNDNDKDDTFGGKVSRFFKNLFGDDDDEAGRYAHVADRAGSVVTVYAQSDAEAERAADILDENGAVDVNERASEYGYSGTTGGSSKSTDLSTDESDTLNVIREDVKIGKREVETGGVRLRSRIVERPVEEKLRLREERVTVQRNSVDRPATTADLQNFKEGEIEMTEYAEVADVTKQARVVEEVTISKDVDERTETISEVARDTEVEVENIKKSDLDRRN